VNIERKYDQIAVFLLNCTRFLFDKFSLQLPNTTTSSSSAVHALPSLLTMCTDFHFKNVLCLTHSSALRSYLRALQCEGDVMGGTGGSGGQLGEELTYKANSMRCAKT
jgi:hypothetical protein